MHILARLIGTAVIVVAGCSNAIVPSSAPTARPSSAPQPTAAPTAVPPTIAVTVPPTTPAPTVEPDRYPVELVGRPFQIQSTTSPGTIVLGRIGLPERIRLPPGEFEVAIAGDLVVTSLDNDAATKLSIWSFSTGGRVVEPFDVSDLNWPAGYVAGDTVIAVATQPAEGTVGRVIRISLPDGAITELVPGSTPRGIQNPVRSLAVSRDGTMLATTICSSGIDFVGGCGPATLIWTADGAAMDTIDVDGGGIVELTDNGALVSTGDHIEWRSLTGKIRWSSPRYVDDRFLQGIWMLDDQTVLATAFVAGEPDVRRVLTFDLETGQQRTIASLPFVEAHGEPPDIAFELSTPTALAIGFGLTNCGPIGNLCEPDEPPIVDADLLDVTSGRITHDAIHITLTE